MANTYEIPAWGTRFGEISNVEDYPMLRVDGVSALNISESDPKFAAWIGGNRISAGSGATVGSDNGIAIGTNANASMGIAIGPGAGTASGTIASNYGGIAIGSNSFAFGRPSAGYSIAIGRNSFAKNNNAIAIGNNATSATANYAIQLGEGNNNQTSSFQVFDYQMLDSNGNIPYARISNDVSLSTVEESYTLVLTEDQKTALAQQGSVPAEAWGDFAITLNTAQSYGYIGNIDCYSIAQNANGDWVFVGGMPVLESALGWVPNVTILQGSTIHNVLSVGNTSADLALKSDIEGYLPLDGGGVVTGNVVIESIDGDNLFSLGSYGKVEIGKGTYAHNNGAIAIGSDTSADNWGNIAIGYTAYAKESNSIAIGPNAEVSGDYSIQLGPPGLNGVQRTVLSTDETFRVWHYPMLDGNGNIPYERLSAGVNNSSSMSISVSYSSTTWSGTLTGTLYQNRFLIIVGSIKTTVALTADTKYSVGTITLPSGYSFAVALGSCEQDGKGIFGVNTAGALGYRPTFAISANTTFYFRHLAIIYHT